MKREATEIDHLTERASATPACAVSRAAQSASGVLLDVPEQPTLREHQRLFVAAVTTPEARPLPVDATGAGRLVRPSATLTSAERLEIYRRSYHARLIECLADDYPVLQEALGTEAFDALCRDYIARHPSTDPNLNGFGRHMAEVCRRHSDLPLNAQLASDLAALEWAIVEAIHAPTAAPLGVDQVAVVPVERWATARLVPNPSLRILRFSYPVNAFFQAHRRGEAPPPPDPLPTAVAVFRTSLTVWRMGLDVPMVRLFEALAAGTPLGAALERITALLDEDAEHAGPRVVGWFREGIASGLFSKIELGADPMGPAVEGR